jgi:uncharacterized membrane protein HdeD (DUF308 family)
MDAGTGDDPITIARKHMAEIVAEHRGWFLFAGGALIVLGVIAVLFPLVTAIAAKVFLGWLILIGGVVEIVHAFSTKRWSAFFYELLMGILYVIVGIWLAFFPLSGIFTLTLILALTFILQGVVQAMMAFHMRPHEGWIWMLIAGLIAIAAGLMVINELPNSATWAIGLMVGITMISTGWAYLILALQAGKTD